MAFELKQTWTSSSPTDAYSVTRNNPTVTLEIEAKRLSPAAMAALGDVVGAIKKWMEAHP